MYQQNACRPYRSKEPLNLGVFVLNDPLLWEKKIWFDEYDDSQWLLIPPKKKLALL